MLPRLLFACFLFIWQGLVSPVLAREPAVLWAAAHLEQTVAEIPVADLPVEARVMLQLIRAGGPFLFAKDGTTFGNREGLLPRRARGYYTEYTVKTPGSRNRGVRRIVAGGNPRTSGEFWYTADHYQSFQRIRE